MKFVKLPNLPTGKVKTVLISSEAGRETIEELKKLEINVLMANPCHDVARAIASHPDMLFHHAGNKNMFYYESNDTEIYEKLRQLGFNLIPIKSRLSDKYPNDIALNAARFGKYLICNMKYTAKEIIEYYKQQGVHIIDVKQGYSKCSVCTVSENAIITSDRSIAKAASACGIDTLLITSGNIKISGYSYGFIGGCCGKISEKTMAFCGNIKMHPDYMLIRDFLKKYDVEIIILGEKSSLFDIGSIIPLMEY